MAKKTLAREHDKFMLRLPPGMRDRIKAKADRADMSMNEAIIYVLDMHFPAPQSLEHKIDELISMVAALKQGNDMEEEVNGLIGELDNTLREISSGKIPVLESFKKEVTKRLWEWDQARAEEEDSAAYDPFDDENYKNPLADRIGPFHPDDPFNPW